MISLFYRMADFDPTAFEGAGERYSYLLLPVKDLTHNFDIDIVKPLNEYIKKISEDTNNTSFNDEYGRRKV